MACGKGHVDVVRLLLADSRVNPAECNNCAIQCACANGHVDVVRLLLADNRVNPADNYNQAIRLACENGHVDVVCLLLADHRVNPADYYNAAILYACVKGHVDVVRILMADNRVNPADRNNEAIRGACYNGHLDVVRILLTDSRVNPADNNNHAIRSACENGHIDVICLLLMDSRINISEVVETSPRFMKKCGKDKSLCALCALAGIKCSKWGLLNPDMYNIDKLRYWQRTLFINLYKQDEEFRNGPYGILLKRRLEIAKLYGSACLTSIFEIRNNRACFGIYELNLLNTSGAKNCAWENLI